MLVSYPILAALAAPVLFRAWCLGGRGVVASISLAVLAACMLQWVGVGLLAARKLHNAELNARIVALEPQAIVTDVWFLPPTLTGSFHRAPVFLVRGPRGLRELLMRLDRAGMAQVLLVTGEAGLPAGAADSPDTVDGPMALARLRVRRVPTRRGEQR